MTSSRSPLDLARGRRGLVLGGLFGAAAPVALMIGLTACRWAILGATAWDRRYGLDDLRQTLLDPVIGGAAVCGGAGWAAGAPAGAWRFARSLAIVFFSSVVLWFILGSMELTPRRWKGMDHPAIYPSELIVLIGPPLASAAILTAARVSRVGKEPGGP